MQYSYGVANLDFMFLCPQVDRIIFTVFLEEDKQVYEELLQKYFPLQQIEWSWTKLHEELCGLFSWLDSSHRILTTRLVISFGIY